MGRLPICAVRIREAGEETLADRELRDLWDQAQLELDKVTALRGLGDGAFSTEPSRRSGKPSALNTPTQ